MVNVTDDVKRTRAVSEEKRMDPFEGEGIRVKRFEYIRNAELNLKISMHPRD